MRLDVVVMIFARRRTVVTRFGAHFENAHRFLDVLQRELTLVQCVDRELALDLIEDRARHGDAAGRRFGLNTSCNIDAVADDTFPHHDQVTDIDADAKIHLRLVLPFLVLGAELSLNLQRALDCVDRTRELREQVISDHIDDPAAMLFHQAAHDRPVGVQCLQRLDLVLGHHLRIASDVG